MEENNGYKGAFTKDNVQVQPQNKQQQPTQQQAPAPAQQQQQQAPAQQAPVQQSQAIAKDANTPVNNNFDTYFNMGSQESGAIELDLITQRSQGNEVRFIAIKLSGYDNSTQPPTPSITTMAIETEEDFNKLKNFISNLNWND